VDVVRVGEEEGVMRYQKKTYPVRHAEGNGYVISLITRDGREISESTPLYLGRRKSGVIKGTPGSRSS